MHITKPQKLIYDMECFSGGAVAVICTGFFVKGKNDEKKMQQSVNELFRINEALRIRICREGSMLTQTVTDFREEAIEIIRFTDRAAFNRYADDYAKVPVDLSGQLCEIKVVVLPGEYGLLVKMHHIISDAWTMALLATQFNRLMRGESPAAYAYSVYCEAEKKYIDSKRYLKDKEYFLEQFRKCSEPVFLCDSRTENGDARRKVMVIDSGKAKKLRDYAEEAGCSVLSLWATALAVYIDRVRNGAERFFMGTTVLNRYTERDLNTAGMFVNTVPVLLEVCGEKSFQENLAVTEDTMMSVFRHQRYNYEDLLSDIRSQQENVDKLYDVVLSFMNATIGGAEDGVSSTWHHNGRQNESLQINIDDRDNRGIFRIQYDYQTEKLNEWDIDELHKNLCKLLFDAVENPHKRISSLEMLSASEKEELEAFNATEHRYDIPEGSTLYSLFEGLARDNEMKICLHTAERNMTFGELLAASGRLDCEIRKITGDKKCVIAVIAERSPEMYCGIYGIIRGGNAYLPVDPTYPESRIEYMLKDSKAAAVICQDKFMSLAADISCINISELIGVTKGTEDVLPCAAEVEDTAYVIYTSGSTGKPKGAGISHRSAINRILWMQDKYPLGDNGVILQKTPYTFDVSVWELFWWGITGGSLAVSKPGEHFLPARILDETEKNRVTHIHFVPSVFEVFLNYLEENTSKISKFASVKYVFLSGESLSATLVNRFYKIFDYGNVTLHNLYGPTECAVDVTYFDCPPDISDPVPIGIPIYNTQMYVVDRYMKLCPPGVQGELCIAGQNVGQGYINNPGLTAERFIDNPFGTGKLYKTGDLAYRREDGNIIFCGRMDGQIKLNGQRIELGEIEAVIGNIRGITSAAVIMKRTGEKNTLIACYTGEKTAPSLIRETCFSKLPVYMVPSHFVHLESLPLNQNGKLDRKALARTEIKISEEADEAPLNDTEKHICEAFGKILGEKAVGRNSNFFELGGTSLSMISLLSEKGFENISAADFMKNPTPAMLSAVLGADKSTDNEYLEPLYISEKSERVLILIPFAGGGAEAYSSFVNSLKMKDDGLSVYYIRYLHSAEECAGAAEEISETLKKYEISVYSHCVGSAVALQIIRFLESKGVCIRRYFAAASIPPLRSSGKNIWNSIPDRVIRAVLMKAGADIKHLSDDKISDLLCRFRKDTDFANSCFAAFSGKINTPVSLIINKKDIFTRNYRHSVSLWERYANNVTAVSYIDSSSHYFQATDAKKLTELLF